MGTIAQKFSMTRYDTKDVHTDSWGLQLEKFLYVMQQRVKTHMPTHGDYTFYIASSAFSKSTSVATALAIYKVDFGRNGSRHIKSRLRSQRLSPYTKSTSVATAITI